MNCFILQFHIVLVQSLIQLPPCWRSSPKYFYFQLWLLMFSVRTSLWIICGSCAESLAGQTLAPRWSWFEIPSVHNVETPPTWTLRSGPTVWPFEMRPTRGSWKHRADASRSTLKQLYILNAAKWWRHRYGCPTRFNGRSQTKTFRRRLWGTLASDVSPRYTQSFEGTIYCVWIYISFLSFSAQKT